MGHNTNDVLHSLCFHVDHLGAECRNWPSVANSALIKHLPDGPGASRPDSVVVATADSVSMQPLRQVGGSPTGVVKRSI